MVLFVGVIIGLVLGLTGAGGSIFAVPLLIILLDLPAQQAIGLSLGAVAISAMFGGLTKLKSGDIQWLPATVYAVIGGVVAPLGNWANRKIDENILMMSFSGLVVIIAGRMWIQANKNPQQSFIVRASLGDRSDENGAICRLNNNDNFKVGLLCVLGISSGAILTGLLSGLFGVGGGFLIVPTLLFLTGISIRQAVATSLIVISAVSTSGFVSFISAGSEVDTVLLGFISAGGLLGMIVGVLVSKKIAGPTLQQIFSVLMVVMAVGIFLKQLT